MKKNILLIPALALATTLFSCKDKKELEEVQIPDAEVVTAAPKVDYGNPADIKAEGKFQMKGLKYSYNALEAAIDAKTVEIHYSKHHVGYANNLNKAIAGTPLESKSIEDILSGLDINNAAVRNNAGGYYNHNLYWDILSPKPGVAGEKLAEAITKEFGSLDNLIAKLKEAGTKQFGSGWAWLTTDATGKLTVSATANQDNPLMPNAEVKGTPILGIDVWEHAYYLNYQNKRADYLDNIFKILDWKSVSDKYEAAITAKQ